MNIIYFFKSFLFFLSSYEHHGIKSESATLYLGSDIETFSNAEKAIDSLENIIYIGRLFKRKVIYNLLALTKKFQKCIEAKQKSVSFPIGQMSDFYRTNAEYWGSV